MNNAEILDSGSADINDKYRITAFQDIRSIGQQIKYVLTSGSQGQEWRDYRRACREIWINGTRYSRDKWDLQPEHNNARNNTRHSSKMISNIKRREVTKLNELDNTRIIDGVVCSGQYVRFSVWMMAKGYNSIDSIVDKMIRSNEDFDEINAKVLDITEQFMTWASAHGLIWIQD